MEPIFQLSARSDFFSVEASVDTLHNRPIVNTRDEPHSSPTKYRRLHVIIGDANMSEWATGMKIGTTSLVIQLLETGWRPLFQLKNPVQTLKSISRDQSRKWKCTFTDGHELNAIAIQRRFLSEAKQAFGGQSRETDWVLSEWEQVLKDLEIGPEAVANRVDWAAKLQLLEQFRMSEGKEWGDTVMQSLDLAYHDIDPETSLYDGLLEAGTMRRLVTDEKIVAAMSCAPPNTRAYIRGSFVKRFDAAIHTIGWNGIVFEYVGDKMVFDMNSLVEDNLEGYCQEVEAATTLSAMVDVIKRKPVTEN